MRAIVPKVGQWAISVATVIIGVLLVLALLTVVSRSPGHAEIYERQQMIEDQLRYVSCLLLIPPDERIPEAVAACQIEPEALTPTTTLAD